MSLVRAGQVCAQLDDEDVSRLGRYAAATNMTVGEAVTVIVKSYLHRWDEAMQGHDIAPVAYPERKR